MATSATYKPFTIFLSSPGDVRPERERARQIIDSVNKTVRDLLHISFHVEFWESLPPQTPSPDEGSVQDKINKIVEKSQMFLLILHKRYGTVEPGHSKSNTEREIDTILAKHLRDPKVTILSYFKAIGENNDPGDQEIKVKELRACLQKKGLFYKEFVGHEDFVEKFTHDLYSLAIKLRLSPFKADCLSHFWTINPGESTIDLAILYRPMIRESNHVNSKSLHWHSRFMPGVSLEDSKAIQKVQKNLRMLGLRAKVYRNSEAPPDLDRLNRLWICAPRIPGAEEALAKYGDKVRFKFHKRKAREATLVWTSQAGAKITIKSPLSKYLRLQRTKKHAAGDWNAHLPHVVAKDFAVVARFGKSTESSTYDFVIAGIRGLGTWGAAWYLDRRYKELRAVKESGDVQMLLEVTYKNGMIADVKDVSKEPSDYFEQALSEKSIRGVIHHAMHGGPLR